MLDWKVYDEKDTRLPGEGDETGPSKRSRRGFYAVLAVLALLAVVAGGVTWQRFREQEARLRQELLAQVRIEEGARRLGQTSRLNSLVAEDVPQEWRSRYASLFRAPVGEARPITVTLESVELEGVRALVEVRVGTRVQRRAYAQRAEGWRRVPLSVDGMGDLRMVNVGGIEIYYQEADRDFAMRLADDLLPLFVDVQQWHRQTPKGLIPAVQPSTITIRPEELGGAWLEPTEGSNGIVLNSPTLAELPATWDVSGEGALRYELARAVWGIAPVGEVNRRTLPGLIPFVDGTRAVLALRWALAPEEYEALRGQWRERVRVGGWQSPLFLAGVEGPDIDPLAPTANGARVLLLADEIYTRMGADTAAIARFLPALQEAEEWDDVSGKLAGATLLELESAVSGRAMPEVTLPLAGAPVPAEADDSAATTFDLRPAGNSYQSVIVEGVENAALELPDGSVIDGSCAILFGEVVIAGQWREEGLRLVAERISVPSLTPPVTYTSEPPENALIYVATDTEGETGYVNGIASVSALTGDGGTTRVLGTPEGQHPLQTVDYSYALRYSTSGIMLESAPMPLPCSAKWLLRFVPGRGMTGAWFVPELSLGHSTHMLWDDRSGRGMLMKINNDSVVDGARDVPFWWLDEGAPRLLGEPDGLIPEGTPILLGPGAETIVTYRGPPEGRPDSPVTLLDSDTLAEQALFFAPTPKHRVSNLAFSADGQYLFLAWTDTGGEGGFRPTTHLQRISLASGQFEEWWVPEQRVLYFIATDAVAPWLYALTGSIGGESALVSIEETVSTTLVDFGPTASVGYMQQCGRGGMAYMTLEFPEEAETRLETALRTMHFIPPGGRRASEAVHIPLLPTQEPVLCP